MWWGWPESWKDEGCEWSARCRFPIVYEALRFEEGFRADIIVEGKVILELKSVTQIDKVHAKQVFTYLKLKRLKLGFVLNFGANLMKEGIERVFNGLSAESP